MPLPLLAPLVSAVAPSLIEAALDKAEVKGKTREAVKAAAQAVIADPDASKRVAEAVPKEVSDGLIKELIKADANQVQLLLQDIKGSFFQWGWRSSIGWICVAAMAFHFLIEPIVFITLQIMHRMDVSMPNFDVQTLLALIFGMLGMGGLRTYDKMKKTDTK